MTSDLLEPAPPLTVPESPTPFARAAAACARTARTMFGMDLRSVALLRIGLGLCLFWVGYANACELRAFYTDEGILTRRVLMEHPGEFLGFSLHLAGGSVPYIALLFALQMIFALMLAVGYRTRISAVASYLLLLSMQNREPMLLFGADIALRIGLFWSIFLPLGERYSVDAATGRARARPGGVYLGIAGIAFIAQVFLIYIIGSLLKTGPTWVADRTAVYYALSLDVYGRPLGHWINQFDWLTHVLTTFTLYLERYGPLLFILPVLSGWGRMLGFILFTGLQIGFGICMVMGYFGPVMITLTCVFLPAAFWSGFAEPSGRRLASGAVGRRFARVWAGDAGAWWRYWRDRQRAWLATRPPADLGPPQGVRVAGTLLLDGGLLVLLTLTVLWNTGSIPGNPWLIPAGYDAIVRYVGLNQEFDMFAPDPQKNDGWFVMNGTLRNGKTIDLFTGASPVTFDKPVSVAGSYQSELWMSYLIAFWDPGATDPEAFARYLGREWNKRHSGGEQLRTLEIDEMSQTNGPDHTKSPVARTALWTQEF